MKWSDEAVEASRLALLRCSFGESIPTNPQMRAALEAASAVAEKEHGNLRAEVERLTQELEEVKSYGIAASRLSEKVRDDGYRRAAEVESRAKSAVARAAELEREVAMWKGLQEGSSAIIDGLHRSVARARREENEGCAQIAERLAPDIPDVADMIRARINPALLLRRALCKREPHSR